MGKREQRIHVRRTAKGFKSPIVSAVLDPELLKRLQDQALGEERSLSQVIRKAITRYLDNPPATLQVMGYVKLDSDILTSSLWPDADARNVFITALLMAQPRALDEPLPEIAIGSLERTGWSVPPGCYGFVPASGPGIFGLAGLDRDAGQAALKRLAAPDFESRSTGFEGRRLVRVEHGFIVLNYARFREKDHTAADRMKHYRKRLALRRNVTADEPESVTLRRNVTAGGLQKGSVTRNVTEEDADAVTAKSSASLRESGGSGNGGGSEAVDDPRFLPFAGMGDPRARGPQDEGVFLAPGPEPDPWERAAAVNGAETGGVPDATPPDGGVQPLARGDDRQAPHSRVAGEIGGPENGASRVKHETGGQITDEPEVRAAYDRSPLEPEVVSAGAPAKGPPWSREACDDWLERFGGTAPGGPIGKALKPLVKAHGWDEVRAAWRRYLGQSEAAYASAARFSATYGEWAGTRHGPRRGKLTGDEALRLTLEMREGKHGGRHGGKPTGEARDAPGRDSPHS